MEAALSLTGLEYTFSTSLTHLQRSVTSTLQDMLRTDPQYYTSNNTTMIQKKLRDGLQVELASLPEHIITENLVLNAEVTPPLNLCKGDLMRQHWTMTTHTKHTTPEYEHAVYMVARRPSRTGPSSCSHSSSNTCRA
jgi:hypothetical protein